MIAKIAREPQKHGGHDTGKNLEFGSCYFQRGRENKENFFET